MVIFHLNSATNTFTHLKNNSKKTKTKSTIPVAFMELFFSPLYSDLMFFSCMFEWVDVLLFEPIKQHKCFFCHLDMKPPDKNHFTHHGLLMRSLRERSLDIENIVTDFSESTNPLDV